MYKNSNLTFNDTVLAFDTEVFEKKRGKTASRAPGEKGRRIVLLSNNWLRLVKKSTTLSF